MNTKGTYYKALFLLVSFSFSTVASFACSLSNLFHELHHHNNSSTAHHDHQDGTRHKHSHSGHHHNSDTKGEGKDDCCSHNVLLFQKTDKAVSRSIEAPDVAFLTAFVMIFSNTTIPDFFTNTIFQDFVRWRLPATIQDLRIVIQSFQL